MLARSITAISCINEVLPAPECPVRYTNSPDDILKFIFCRAICPCWYTLLTDLNSIIEHYHKLIIWLFFIKQSFYKIIGIKNSKIVNTFTDTNKANWNTEVIRNIKNHPALCGTVKFSNINTGNRHNLAE